MKKYFSLFLAFFKIGLFTFGGGYAMISLVQNECVEKKAWINSDEFLDMIAVSESTPGPIAINMATFIGKKQGGFLGALLATLGVVLPSFLIIFCISLFLPSLLTYPVTQKIFRGISCAVGVIVFFAGLKLLKSVKKHPLSVVLFIITATLTVLSELNVLSFSYLTLALILFGGLMGLVFLRETAPKKEKTK